MDENELAKVENLCQALYANPDATLRNQARQQLEGFENNPSYVQHCQFILDRSSDPTSHMMAATSLLKLLTEYWNNFCEDEIMNLRDYLLNYIAENHNSGKIKVFVLAKLIQTTCRITKLGWQLGSQRFRDIKDRIFVFFGQNDVDMVLVGLRLCSELVREMNTHLTGTAITAHRRVAVSFRDACLQEIFTCGFTILEKVQNSSFNYNKETQEGELILNAITVLHACLAYDYIGTDPDEATEEYFIIQMPSEWKTVMDNTNTSMLLFQILFSGKASRAVMGKLMEVIVLMVSVRRSIFPSEEARLSFLTVYCEGCVTLLTDYQDLIQNEHVYTQLCRLLVGIKNNYQLDDLTKLPCYQAWVQKAAEFTMASFNSLQHTEGSVHFIIQLWARLCMAMPFLRSQLPVFLETIIPNIFESFVQAQLSRVGRMYDEGLCDEIYVKGDRDFQLKHLPYLARWNYSRAHSHLMGSLRPRMQAYEQAVLLLTQGQMSNDDYNSLCRLECEMSWLFYVAGCMLSSIMSYGDNKAQDMEFEAEMCAKIFQLTDSINARLDASSLSHPPTRYLDEALLYIFGQFRLNHIRSVTQGRMRPRDSSMFGDSGGAEIYTHLSKHLDGSVTQDMILAAIVQKIISNLKCQYVHSSVIKESLMLLHNIATGFSSAQVLCNSDVAKTFLLSHGAANFPFMLQMENLKHRSLFYEILTMILMQEEYMDLFDQFMQPFEATFQQLENVSDVRNKDVVLTGVGLARDLTGCLRALGNSRGYLAFFNWIYPRYFRIFLRMFEPWWDYPFVCIPMLKFISNFTHQKLQRIDFPISSPNGIFLFREISKVLITYGNRVLSTPETQMDDPYKERYKGIMVSMTILHRSLSGCYVNFGMFEIYEDPSLRDSIMVVINLVRKYRYEILMSYKKISTAWWKLLELLFRQHFEILAQDQQVFDYLFKSLYEGMQNRAPSHSSPVLHSLDHVFTWIHIEGSLKKQRSETLPVLQKYMNDNINYVLRVFVCLLNLHLFGSETTTWSICKPIYSIVIVFPELWQAYLNQMLQHQSVGIQDIIQESFMIITQNMPRRITDKNRDLFIKNLIQFKNETKGQLKKWDSVVV